MQKSERILATKHTPGLLAHRAAWVQAKLAQLHPSFGSPAAQVQRAAVVRVLDEAAFYDVQPLRLVPCSEQSCYRALVKRLATGAHVPPSLAEAIRLLCGGQHPYYLRQKYTAAGWNPDRVHDASLGEAERRLAPTGVAGAGDGGRAEGGENNHLPKVAGLGPPASAETAVAGPPRTTPSAAVPLRPTPEPIPSDQVFFAGLARVRGDLHYKLGQINGLEIVAKAQLAQNQPAACELGVQDLQALALGGAGPGGPATAAEGASAGQRAADGDKDFLAQLAQVRDDLWCKLGKVETLQAMAKDRVAKNQPAAWELGMHDAEALALGGPGPCGPRTATE